MNEKRMQEQAAARKVRAMDAGDVTIALWLDAWRVFFPGGRTADTERHQDYMVRAFRERHGRRRLAALTPLLAQEWATRDPRSVKELRAIWRKALIMELVPFNVWRVVELPPRRRPPRPVPTPAQLELALERCRELGGWWDEWADLLTFTAYTGARLQGVTGLTHRNVDVPGRRAVLLEKGGKARRVALLGRALPAIESALSRHPRAETVFRSKRGARLDGHLVSDAWRAVRGDFAGPFHSLRHYAGTWLAANGVDERDIAVQLGHTDSEGRPYVSLVRSLYVHPDTDAALARLEGMIG